MDDRRPQSSCHVTETLNFGIDRILKNDVKSGDLPIKKKDRYISRTVFTLAQKNLLEYYFQMEKYITIQNRKALASTLDLTELQIKVWFQNRRMKWRHSMSSNK